MKHFIYRTTCLVTGKFYIGMHSGDEGDAYLGSGHVLRASIRKHGRANHVREILEFCPDRETLSRREAAVVTEQLIADELCMNLVPGGIGGIGKKHTDQAKAKCRQAAAARKPDHYLSGERHGMFGRTHTPEVIERIRVAAQRPKPPFSDEHRRKLSEAATRRHARARNP
jgi:hypothetical protein